jgi:hypothetical protein
MVTVVRSGGRLPGDRGNMCEPWADEESAVDASRRAITHEIERFETRGERACSSGRTFAREAA